MIDRDRLLKDLQKLTTALVDDLRQRSEQVEDISERVRGQHRDAKQAGRTDRSYEEWREDLLAQVAVAWVLATVFVRFCEDNDLYDTPLLSGPDERRDLAGDHRISWLSEHPASGDRDWLLEVFARYRTLPGMRELLDAHNPLWHFAPSDDGARSILDAWWMQDEGTGDLVHDFLDPELNTRFLGDLYQDLSEHAKKAFALLQTPDFVEEFILDRTLDPALETFGLPDTKLIDPTCGSGHFLLGAFDRILERWRQREPGTPIRELAQRTLNAVNGVDLNPFAVAISRFRLLVVALRSCEVRRLEDAPDFRFRVAVGDSLIHGTRSGELFTGAEGFSALMEHRYPSEDGELADEILEAATYQAVVGNPPYITVKEPALRNAYRSVYSTAHGQYSLGVPFTERFFDLASMSGSDGAGGFVGLITANSFMKRQFGAKMIEDWFPRRDLTHVIDTAGAYIPGHGTPTVILFGRNQGPTSGAVRCVLGIRGEPGTPVDPAFGKVWSAIRHGVERVGWEDEFVSIEDVARERLGTHPWSLRGGVAPRVFEALEKARRGYLQEVIDPGIGRAIRAGADEAFVRHPEWGARYGCSQEEFRPFVVGQTTRDWASMPQETIWYPYPLGQRATSLYVSHLWPLRSFLAGRRTFQGVMADAGLEWWEYMQHTASAYATPLSITFAFVATHNHFVLDRGGKVFKQSAPVIKLPEGATETDHLRLLGLLNSSTACFWMTQVFHGKGQGGVGQESRAEWEEFREFDGTKLKQFPIPNDAPVELARTLDKLAQKLSDLLPGALVESAAPTRERLSDAQVEAGSVRAQMVAAQEELDWQCYQIYGLTTDDLRAPAESVPELEPGQRAFEIVLARKMAAGETESTWFERHDSQPISELPAHWPGAYRDVVERRIALIESDRSIALLERPEHKRRWNWDRWEDMEHEALADWLLDRMEDEALWSAHELRTTAQIGDVLQRDAAFVTAAGLYAGRSDFDPTELVESLVASESVPFQVGYRFKASGMRRRREWEEVWALQRREDEIDARTELDASDPQYLSETAAKALKAEEGLDEIPVPPKYRKSDFSSDVAYRLRGKLDVPQERFISYPNTHIGSDTSLVIGWAGWNHLQRAQALAAHYGRRRDEGAAAAELTPLLAGLQELVPWLKQWHNEVDPTYGTRMGDFFASFVETEAGAVDLTTDDLATWTPNS